ncbi:CD151 antigen-like isoform X2 [Haliotis rufescens]|nr:CD151 antigen-like isoform X2 [Haliotis rufescens]XP_048256448.1 CD151 antigen-like isoform X2 [Haliotis rufescens]
MTINSFSPIEETQSWAGFESNRMVGTSCAKWIKNLLLIAFVVVLICGIAILGIGIWTHESEYGSKQLSSLIDIPLYEVDSFLLIGCGVAIIVITLLGVCGVMTQYKCIMGLHLWALAFLSVSLFVAGILGYVLIGELEEKVKGKLEDTVMANYGVDLPSNSKNLEITESWDRIQQTFKCCGAFGTVNSSTSWAIYREQSEWYKKGFSKGRFVPLSCCDKSLHKYLNDCTGLTDVPDAPPRHGPPVLLNMADLNYTLYTVGCFDVLDGYLRGTGIIIGTTAIVVGVFLLVELVLSVCMYRMLR